MNKEQLIDALAEETGFSKKLVTEALDGLTKVVSRELKFGNEVTFTGLGKLLVKERAARKGRNPSNGEAIDIPAKKVVDFHPAKPLREAVAG